MDKDLILKLHSHNFKVNNKGIISKYSQRSRRYDVAGQINKAGVYFHAQNVAPFKQGQNTFKEIFGENTSYTYTPPAAAIKEIEHKFTFEDYTNTTKTRNQFLTYLKAFHKETLGTELTTNLYDIRGVKGGYFEDATLFPYINYNNEFLTAKVVKYNTVTGKRIKANYSNTWFHSDKTIKEQLGIEGKISKSINCFFGEHLIAGNDKPIVIVEAEKTAILLSYIFKDIVFIATGGVAKLKNLNWSFLVNRQVFVFPDNDAKDWFKIAEKRDWWISNTLENEGLKGEDVADYLTPSQDEKRLKVWDKLHAELLSINNGTLANKKEVSKELHFEHKKNISFRYCLPIPLDAEINYYWDNAKGRKTKGKHFLIYDNDFQVLNANIDFHKPYKDEFGNWQQLDAYRFLKKLEKCFRIIKHLNKDKDYISLFSKVLYNLLINSNFVFNISYIERVLLYQWDKDTNNIDKYIKTRNWRFYSKEYVSRKDFQKRLNEDKKLAQTNRFLLKLQPLLNKNKFILPEDIGLHSKQINPYVWELIKRYNKAVFGSTTKKNYTSKVKVQEYVTWANSNTSNTPPIRYIKENTGVGQEIITEYLNFKPDNDALNLLIEEIDYFTGNLNQFTFERVKGRLLIKPKLESLTNSKNIVISTEISNKEAFNYKYDYTGTVLEVDESTALYKGGGFLASWILFHYPELDADEYDRKQILRSPLTYYNQKILKNYFN